MSSLKLVNEKLLDFLHKYTLAMRHSRALRVFSSMQASKKPSRVLATL